MLPVSMLLSSNRTGGSAARRPARRKDLVMIAFELTEDQVAARKWVREFAEREIRPVAPHYDETEEFPWPLLAEELAWGCAGIALGLLGTGLPLVALMSSGTPDQVAEWAPRLFGTWQAPAVAAF